MTIQFIDSAGGGQTIDSKKSIQRIIVKDGDKKIVIRVVIGKTRIFTCEEEPE